MPIYEYQCPKCGTFEVVQRITEPALKKCPTCKGKVERLMSRTSFVLKGSGWYATDYARSAKPESKSESKDAKGAVKSDSVAANGDGAGSGASGSDSAKSDSAKSDSAKSSSAETAKPSGSEKSAAK